MFNAYYIDDELVATSSKASMSSGKGSSLSSMASTSSYKASPSSSFVPSGSGKVATSFANYSAALASSKASASSSATTLASNKPSTSTTPTNRKASESTERRRTADSGCSSGGTGQDEDVQSVTNATTSTYLGSSNSTVIMPLDSTPGETSHSSTSTCSYSGESATSGRFFFMNMPTCPVPSSTAYSPFEDFTDYNRDPPPNSEALPMVAIALSNDIKNSPAKSQGFLKKLRNKFRVKPTAKTSSFIEYQVCDNTSQMSEIEDLGEKWIDIKYHEYGDVIGTNYQSTAAEVSVTGLSEMTSPARFSLCAIARPNRSNIVHYTRSLIKEGIRFYYENRNVWLDCIGPQQIFVQAPLYAYCHGQALSTVYRLNKGNGMPVFSASMFEQLLTEAERRGKDYVVSLEQLCQVRIGFIKGWGQNYKIPTILGLPAWLEIHFLHAFADVDRLAAKFQKKATEERRAASRLRQQQQQQPQTPIVSA